MGWGRCGTDSKGRNIGYYYAAICDHPGCKAKIDRGLAYACGGMHGLTHMGGDEKLDGFELCCEGYFCSEHLTFPCFEHEDGSDLFAPLVCRACAKQAETAYRTDPEWRSLWPTDEPPLAAQGIEAGTAATVKQGAVHESPVGSADAPLISRHSEGITMQSRTREELAKSLRYYATSEYTEGSCQWCAMMDAADELEASRPSLEVQTDGLVRPLKATEYKPDAEDMRATIEALECDKLALQRSNAAKDEALRAAYEKMRYAVEPDDVCVLNKIAEALFHSSETPK
jgi:hypothetical protein